MNGYVQLFQRFDYADVGYPSCPTAAQHENNLGSLAWAVNAPMLEIASQISNSLRITIRRY